jgi:AcrR family transcriptional regulator
MESEIDGAGALGGLYEGNLTFRNMSMSSENASAENASAEVSRPRAPRQERGRARVADLVASAAAVFEARGFEAATMSEIAARARAAIGTLYLFFPSKELLASAILEDLAAILSARLAALREQTRGQAPALIADALFSTLAAFVSENPVYATLLDTQGDDAWRRSVRRRRRHEIAALFSDTTPPLPPERAERLAVIVPQLMRIPVTVDGGAATRAGIIDELRAMLTRHLEP